MPKRTWSQRKPHAARPAEEPVSLRTAATRRSILVRSYPCIEHPAAATVAPRHGSRETCEPPVASPRHGPAVHLHHATSSAASTRPTARCSRTSRCRSTRAPRSACSAPNGAGKSTLLRIMAGHDDGFTGEARLTPGLHRRLPRPGAAARPGQGRARQRDGRRRPPVQSTARPLRRGHGRCGPTPTPTTRSSARCRPSSRTRSTPPTRGTSSATSRSPWTRCAARPTTPTSPRCRAASGAASRCAACCSPSPTCCCSTSRPTTSTPRPSPGSSGSCRSTTGTVVAITHDRYFLDNVARLDPRARPRPRHPVRGQLLVVARAEAGPARPGGEAGIGPPAHPRSASSSGCAWRPRPARPRARPASTAYEKLLAEAEAAERAPATGSRSRSRPGPASATR